MFRLRLYKANLNINKCKFNISQILKTFTATNPPAATGAGQTGVSAAPPKTKEQIKIETQMQQWPEYLRNPPKGYIDLELAKELYEELYKYHQGDKKYMGPYDVPIEFNRDFVSMVNNVKTVDAIADYFKNYEGFLPEHFIMGKFSYLACTSGEKTPEFFEIILPQVKKLIINADRQTAKNLYKAVEAGSWMNLADAEFWDMIEYKLVNERLYRYLELKQAAAVAYFLTISGRGSKALLNQLEVYFIKHRKAISLDRNIRKYVEAAYSIAGGSETLFAALEDPNIEVPSVDAKIPKMDRLAGAELKKTPEISHVENKQIGNH